jgi:hypothetical protein
MISSTISFAEMVEYFDVELASRSKTALNDGISVFPAGTKKLTPHCCKASALRQHFHHPPVDRRSESLHWCLVKLSI